tara:strand:+ start:252 stop:653 length:402 start_codon:yes stop_codon:yes gene_type:complete
MSILKVNTIQNASGGNASTTDNIQQGIAKAWVNFDGTVDSSSTNPINDSFNVSGVTDNATGIYTITFATNMSNVNYVVNISKRLSETGGVTSTDDVLAGLVNTPQTVSTVKVYGRVGTTDTDCKGIHVVVFGD